MDVKSYTEFECIGATVDDAVGEAFDKVARIMGLEYPGGVNIDKFAKMGESNIDFAHKNILAGTYNFSFSGIKTAVINYVHNKQQKGEEINIPNISASFQTFVVGELAGKTLKAMKELGSKKLVVAGGVSANSFLKSELTKKCQEFGFKLFMPELKYCTDNAAMIGAMAYFEMMNGLKSADFDLTAKSTLPLGE